MIKVSSTDTSWKTLPRDFTNGSTILIFTKDTSLGFAISPQSYLRSASLGGGSLEMWREYFGAGARIVGLDIDPECKKHEQDSIEIFIGSQVDPEIIRQIINKYPRIDIVLDDGSHINDHMISSFELLYEHIHPKGVYMVEDTHTCYWDEYGGGLRRSGSFIEYAKNKIDELNAVHARNALPISSFTRTTDCIAIYDSVVVFEKRPQGARQAPITEPL